MTRKNQPAVSALLYQLLGFSAAATAILIGNIVFNTPSTVLTLVLGTGTIAAFFSWRGKEPGWWVPIHLVFPVAVLLASVLEIPSTWYLAGFLISIGLYGTIYKTRVPYYPSRKPVWESLAGILEKHSGITKFIDLGCGMGGCALYLSIRHPAWQIVGIELAPLPWLVCRLRTLWKPNPKWIYGNYQNENLSNYGVIFSYLSPAAMPGLEEKLRAELAPTSTFVTLEFPLPTWKKSAEIETDAGTLFIYKAQ